MVIHLFLPNFDDDLGPFGPEIRKWMAPEPEPFEEEWDRNGGDFDQDEYWPYDDKLAA